MKIVLIDDETIIVNGIKNMILRLRDQMDEVYAFSDASEFELFVKNNSFDLLITDICMEGLDGFDVINMVKRYGSCTKFAIISGFNYFSYAKKSIEYGVLDYLLKPIEESELLKLIERAEYELASEEQEHVVSSLKDYIDGRISYQTLLSNLEGNVCNLIDTKIRVVKCMEKSNDKIFESLNGKYDVVFKLSAIHSNYFLVFNNFIAASELAEVLANVTKHFCIVSEEAELKEIGEAYLQCRRGGACRPFYADSGVLFWHEVDNKHSNDSYLTKLENEFYVALKGKNQKNAKNCLIKLLNEPDCKTNVRFCEEFIARLNDLLKNKSESINSQEYVNCQQLADKIMSVINTGKRVEKMTENLLLDAALEYIELNYCKSITLATVANEISVNYYYLSRLFRDQMKLNFKQYITQKRLTYAIKLLKNSSLKVYEIASLCGYENVNTFNEAFKDTYSVTPTEYRQQHVQ